MELTNRSFRNLDQQVNILREKGMLIENEEYAKNWLKDLKE